MDDVFGQELHEQLAEARRRRVAAQVEGDEDGVQACAGRVAQLLRIAESHGLDVGRTATDGEEG
ncbi:hypothetical protein ABT095_38405 [Kitasatospora sp. NPDC002227]|uniref:hypothetical protein n=1 Tax=Kitasatospora sp. NPDC002227 TaxID=3154773 RepID=UPI0033243594